MFALFVKNKLSQYLDFGGICQNSVVPKIKKIRGRENIAVGTWNVRTLRPAGKLEQLTHAMSRYHWNTVGLCEMRWKNFGEMSNR